MTDSNLTRRGFVVLCTASLAATLAGCGGGGKQVVPPTADTTVTGMVLNSLDSDLPVEGATIVMGTVSATTVTTGNTSPGNAVGSFRLLNVPTGTTQAVITFQNRRRVGTSDPPEYEKYTDTQTVAFFPGVARGATGPLELFVNVGQVSGRVLLPNGTPASSVFVSVAPDGLVVTTDAAGNFLVENILPGSIEIASTTGTAAGSKTVTVGNGINASGDLQLVEDPNPNPPSFPATLVGKVSTTNGQSGAGAIVLLLRDGKQIEQTVSNAAGDFAFYVPVGNYAVRVLKDGYIDNTVSGSITSPNTPLRLDVAVEPRI